ncbi:MAG TPA: hydantoinase/oxoprolinase family protein [Methanotrichaceae archaeon]|nr:hydantoinase/oxoprolinase family protein [Methanotrichaceae archaeon]
MILGLDIGGANTKAASSDGSFVDSIYLPLWRGAPLVETLCNLAKTNPEAVGVVMTGELADCYQNKLAGIECIKSAVESAFRCPVHYWGVNGFDPRAEIDLAAANWSASAALVAQDIGDCLFVDMGSTTTDIIPIKDVPLAAATDYERLINGELVYMGKLRTSIGALLHSVMIDGQIVPLSPELFAITADAYLALEEISPDQYTCDAPDGGIKNRASSLRRLARTACADLEEISEPGAMAIASQVREHQVRLLVQAIDRQVKARDIESVAAAGIGESLIVRAAGILGLSCVRLSEKYGRRVSDVFPAYAVARLLKSQ